MEEGARREQRGEGGGTGLALTTLLRHQKTARLRLQVVVNEMAHDVAAMTTSGGGEQRVAAASAAQSHEAKGARPWRLGRSGRAHGVCLLITCSVVVT